ncbi:ATPase [Pseudomonas viridiflava]|uniref:ATPase n=1 Tax=Pseudomonas viridiflava TaxID=33069 RepID=UPI000F021A7C|nr:ATPase [Pseudomonas viridiflava]
MQRRISLLLKEHPGLKGREIASKLGFDKKEVNRFLDVSKALYLQDDAFCWSLNPKSEFVVDFSSQTHGSWIKDVDVERELMRAGSPLELPYRKVRILIGDGKPMMLCAIAKILALANQLALEKRSVSLDFSGNTKTLSYLSRAAFISRLHKKITVLPHRPDESESQIYLANNLGLVELLEINDSLAEKNVPERIKHSYEHLFGRQHANKLFTIVAESVTNVQRHSRTQVPGVAAMQHYKFGKDRSKVLTVISDSGAGICATLRPALKKYWPEVAAQFPANDEASNPKLIVRAMQEQGLSCTGQGGAGLHATLSKAQLLDASVNIRQETFSVCLSYKGGQLQQPTWVLDLPKLAGTHIVFEFLTTKLAAA